MKNLVKVILISLILMSCNRVEKKQMEDFIVVEIENIYTTSENIGLKFKEANDGVWFATINKENFDDFEILELNIKENKEVKIKGVIYDFNSNEKNFFSSSDSIVSTIIDVKEVAFIDN